MNGWIFLNFYSKQEINKKSGELKSAITHLFHWASHPNFPADINFHAHVYIWSYLKTERWLQEKPVSRLII